MTTAEHWALALVGKPWQAGARGPDAFDCWGLVRWVYAERLGIELPLFPGLDPLNVRAVAGLAAEVTTGTEWERLTRPDGLCAVAMSTRRAFHHVGVWLPDDGGVVLHAADRSAVVAQGLSGLRFSGINRIEFYKHARQCSTS